MVKNINTLNNKFIKKFYNSKYKNDRKLLGKRRIFDHNLHDQYDIPARKVIKKALGGYVIDNPNPFKQDLIVTDQNAKYKYIEVQVISQWINEKFPYPKVYVYERKKVYGYDTLYITLNKNLTKAFIFDRESIDQLAPRRVKKYSREFVYDIPWHRIITVYINDLNKELIELY